MKSLVFPGQGSQYVGMGKDLLDSFPEIKATFEEVNDALGQNLSRLMFDVSTPLLRENLDWTL